ncbi:hypothetical protein [Hymenobacter antarcticus]|uniref:hypothetical protein n=1 Tax=Hymenobacter antarcticus TaxID=486270 RepID=UPI0031EE32FE
MAYLYIDVSVRDSYSGQWNSANSVAARENGVLLREYVVTPRVIRFENYRVEFTDCWVEEPTRISHDFIFFRNVTKLGGSRLVLNYQGQRLAPDPDSSEAMLVLGGEGYGQDVAASKYDKQPYRLAYQQFIALPPVVSERNDTLYFSIIRSWQDKRQALIKVYPKPKTGQSIAGSPRAATSSSAPNTLRRSRPAGSCNRPHY